MDPSVIGFRGHHISDSEDFESSSAASFTDRRYIGAMYCCPFVANDGNAL